MSCIDRHDISWRSRVNESQRATVSSHLLLRGFEPQHLPSGLTSPLIYNVQKMYIYLNSLYKENIKRIF